MEFHGHCKVVDQPRANRALVRANSATGTAPQTNLGVFGGPSSNRITAPAAGRRTSEFARTGSKTSVFGAETSATAAKPTGRKPLARRSTSPIATPAEGTPSNPVPAERPRTGRKSAGYWKPDSVLSAENFRPLAAGEKTSVYCARGDNMSHRPHSAGHGKAHLPSSNRESVLFPKDTNEKPNHADPALLGRYDQRFTRSASDMARFKVTPNSARRCGMNQQTDGFKFGKHQSETGASERAHTLEGVLRPERVVRPVDRNYRPVAPWR